MPVDASSTEQLAAHRRALARQRDLLRSVPLWYVGPLVPGVVVLLVAEALSNGAPMLTRVGLLVSNLALVAVVFGAVAWVNARAARKLDAEISALDTA